MIAIHLGKDADTYFYVHDKGEQYFLHYDWWPELPFIYHVPPNTYSGVEFIIKKEIEMKDEHCDEESTVKYHNFMIF